MHPCLLSADVAACSVPHPGAWYSNLLIDISVSSSDLMSWPSASSGGLRRVCQSAKQAQNSQANGLDYFWTFLAAICLGGSHELVLPSWVKVLWQPAREEEANRIKKITLFLRIWISCETALSSQPATGTSSEISGNFPVPVGAGCCLQMTPGKTAI